VTSGKIGLVVITLERYFKIVHAIAHRKHCRDWMTSVGVAVPWITGFFTTTLPTIVRAVGAPDLCQDGGHYPTKDGIKVTKLHGL